MGIFESDAKTPDDVKKPLADIPPPPKTALSRNADLAKRAVTAGSLT